MDKNSVLPIATIVGVHGIKGYLKLYSFAESTELFEPGKQITVHHRDGNGKIYTVRDLKPCVKSPIIALEGVADRDSAEELIGLKIFIKRSELPELDKESWYWCDLIGLDVYHGDDAYIGKIERIFSTGSNDVFIVKGKKKETLIPAIESVIRNIDLHAQKMTVDLPDGL